ncbi:MAG TPA: hypothetical protein VGA56_04120 [Opitutaceae bacterium]
MMVHAAGILRLTAHASDAQARQEGCRQVDLDLEQKVWKPVHEWRLKAGMASSWGLYSLVFPGGDSNEYYYATINDYQNFSDMENPYPAEVFTKALPNMPLSELGSKTTGTRDLVRSEVWELIDYVQ